MPTERPRFERTDAVPKFDVWIEGYLVTGMEGVPAKAKRVGKDIVADNFPDACEKVFGGDPVFNKKRLTYWGCRCFNNETDARLAFG